MKVHRVLCVPSCLALRRSQSEMRKPSAMRQHTENNFQESVDTKSLTRFDPPQCVLGSNPSNSLKATNSFPIHFRLPLSRFLHLENQICCQKSDPPQKQAA
jgi:hypothetical protein